jgi:hypothetical protein
VPTGDGGRGDQQHPSLGLIDPQADPPRPRATPELQRNGQREGRFEYFRRRRDARFNGFSEEENRRP